MYDFVATFILRWSCCLGKKLNIAANVSISKDFWQYLALYCEEFYEDIFHKVSLTHKSVLTLLSLWKTSLLFPFPFKCPATLVWHFWNCKTNSSASLNLKGGGNIRLWDEGIMFFKGIFMHQWPSKSFINQVLYFSWIDKYKNHSLTNRLKRDS